MASMILRNAGLLDSTFVASSSSLSSFVLMTKSDENVWSLRFSICDVSRASIRMLLYSCCNIQLVGCSTFWNMASARRHDWISCRVWLTLLSFHGRTVLYAGFELPILLFVDMSDKYYSW